MGIFERFLSNEKTVFHLANEMSLSERGEPGRPISNVISRGLRTTDHKMIDFIYKQDAVSFNTTNKMVQTIMKPGYKFVGGMKTSQMFFEDFFNKIGQIGEEVTLKKLIEYIFKDVFMYGNSFVELVYNKKQTKIVDLKLITCELVDYARTKENDIAINEYGKPIGYTVKIPYGMSARGKGDEIPEAYQRFVQKDDQMIFLLPHRVAHFKINSFGDRYWGLGLLEPVLQQVLRKKSIEEAHTNSIYTRGTYPVVAKVGDINHEPSEAELKAVLETLQNMRHDRYFAFPYFVEVKPLEVASTDAAESAMLYLSQDQAAAAGIPMPFATSAGEATNRATLNNQQQIFELVLEYYAKEITDSFERFILRRIQTVNGIKDYPLLKWGDVKAEEKNDKSKRLSMAIGDKVLSPKEARKYILEVEDIEPDDKAYEEWIKSEKKSEKKVVKETPKFEEDIEKEEITTKKQ